jgi:hypothetical protein
MCDFYHRNRAITALLCVCCDSVNVLTRDTALYRDCVTQQTLPTLNIYHAHSAFIVLYYFSLLCTSTLLFIYLRYNNCILFSMAAVAPGAEPPQPPRHLQPTFQTCPTTRIPSVVPVVMVSISLISLVLGGGRSFALPVAPQA